jgi:hypothetical protein
VIEAIVPPPLRVSIREDDTSVRILLVRNNDIVDAIPVAVINKAIAYLSEDVHNAIINLAQHIGVGFAECILGLTVAGIEIQPASEPDAPKSN